MDAVAPLVDEPTIADGRGGAGVFTGTLFVGLGIVTGVLTRVGRHKFGVVAGEPWRWWRRASGVAVAGGVVLLFVGTSRPPGSP